MEKEGTDGDVSDAKMIWMYAICHGLAKSRAHAAAWAELVGMHDETQPLKGYAPEKWDPRTAEWAPLDLGAQAAAERGGTSLDEAWAL